jgi:hypothetical protein
LLSAVLALEKTSRYPTGGRCSAMQRASPCAE